MVGAGKLQKVRNRKCNFPVSLFCIKSYTWESFATVVGKQFLVLESFPAIDGK